VLVDAGDDSGYILARMRYEIVLSPEAVEDRGRLRAYDWAIIRDAIEKHLRYEPMKVSKSRIKRLHGLSRPQYRLRVGDFRVFYDVSGTEVQVLTIIPKPEVEAWLSEAGEPQ
jgi:mRNA-degrading endonuclease RelE of RelBE toxin-antitoxin system